MITLDATFLGADHPALQNGGQAELIRFDETNAWVQPVLGDPVFGWPIYIVPLAAISGVVPTAVFVAIPLATIDTLSQPGAF